MRPSVRIGKSDFARVWLMAEVVHLGVTEFGISVGPRLLLGFMTVRVAEGFGDIPLSI